ncbi:hypothetical protein ACHAO7_010078 [Fusarium culmorum]
MGKTHTIAAKKLVVTIPQTIENIFSAFGYFADVADIPGLDVSLQNVGLRSPTKTPSIPGSNGYLLSGSPNQFLLRVGFNRSEYTVADGKRVIHKELETLASVGAVPASVAKTVTFPCISNHAPYDLHVTREDIKEGFYTKLTALEGYQNTYWTGAAFAGHNSGLIWKWNEETVLPALKKDLGL